MRTIAALFMLKELTLDDEMNQVAQATGVFLELAHDAFHFTPIRGLHHSTRGIREHR